MDNKGVKELIAIWGVLVLGVGFLYQGLRMEKELLRIRVMGLYKGKDEDEMEAVVKKMSGSELEALYYFLKARKERKKITDPDLKNFVTNIKAKYNVPVLNKLLK